jgi:hypothetical protein
MGPLGLRGAALTKAIRADIAAQVKAGALPKLKYSVRLETGSMYQAVHVRISGLRPLLRREAYAVDPSGRFIDAVERDRYTTQAALVLKNVTALVTAYQQSESHLQSDYYRTNFYDHVGFDNSDEQAARAMLEIDMVDEAKKAALMPIRSRKLDEAEPGLYVSIVDGTRFALVAGPYPTHDAAKADVERVRTCANKMDPRAAFWAFGTCRVKTEAERLAARATSEGDSK